MDALRPHGPAPAECSGGGRAADGPAHDGGDGDPRRDEHRDRRCGRQGHLLHQPRPAQPEASAVRSRRTRFRRGGQRMERHRHRPPLPARAQRHQPDVQDLPFPAQRDQRGPRLAPGGRRHSCRQLPRPAQPAAVERGQRQPGRVHELPRTALPDLGRRQCRGRRRLPAAAGRRRSVLPVPYQCRPPRRIALQHGQRRLVGRQQGSDGRDRVPAPYNRQARRLHQLPLAPRLAGSGQPGAGLPETMGGTLRRGPHRQDRRRQRRTSVRELPYEPGQHGLRPTPGEPRHLEHRCRVCAGHGAGDGNRRRVPPPGQ